MAEEHQHHLLDGYSDDVDTSSARMAVDHQDSTDRRTPNAHFTLGKRLVATGILAVALVAVAVTSPATVTGKDGRNSSPRPPPSGKSGTASANGKDDLYSSSRPPMLGKSKKDDDKDKDDSKDCDDGEYSERTLKTAHEMPYAGLFRDNRGQKSFEASDVVTVGDDAYSVCDSSWAIFKFDWSLTPFDPGNVVIKDRTRDPLEESGYEALLHNSGTFYAVRESVAQKTEPGEDERYAAVVEELGLSLEGGPPLHYDVAWQCRSEFEFEGTSKGFEGAVAARDAGDDALVILGLCEANFCSEKREKERGNGRLVAMKKLTNGTDCIWKTIRDIAIPSSADFLDYSAISMDPSTGRVAITSQEDSKLWVGKLNGLDADGKLDVGIAEFDDEVSTVYSFQKLNNCETIYCNIEGIHFLNDEMLIGVSDKMKAKGKQDFRCFDKDQSVHVFMLP